MSIKKVDFDLYVIIYDDYFDQPVRPIHESERERVRLDLHARL